MGDTISHPSPPTSLPENSGTRLALSPSIGNIEQNFPMLVFAPEVSERLVRPLLCVGCGGALPATHLASSCPPLPPRPIFSHSGIPPTSPCIQSNCSQYLLYSERRLSKDEPAFLRSLANLCPPPPRPLFSLSLTAERSPRARREDTEEHDEVTREDPRESMVDRWRECVKEWEREWERE
jgi:hypothetical protein